MSPGEVLLIKDSSVDLLTVCQAVHWFDLEPFYSEAKRVLKPNGIIALYGYFSPQVRIEPRVNELINEMYYAKLHKYFHPKSKILEERYVNLEFPFENVHRSTHDFEMKGTLDFLVNWIKTWSGYQEYKKVNGDLRAENLMKEFEEDVSKNLNSADLKLYCEYFVLIGESKSQ